MENKLILKRIGEKIRTVRREKDFSQEYLAFKLGYKDKSSFAKLERGELETVDLCKLIEICIILDYSLFELLKNCDIC